MSTNAVSYLSVSLPGIMFCHYCTVGAKLVSQTLLSIICGFAFEKTKKGCLEKGLANGQLKIH